MSISRWQKIKNWMQRPVYTGGYGKRVTPTYSYTDDTTDYRFFLYSDYHYIRHPVEQNDTRGIGSLEVDYKLENFDERTLPKITLKRMINLLKHNSSGISQSAQNFRTALTHGYKLEGTPRAKTNVQKIFRMLQRRRKPINILLGQMADGIFFGGGLYREIILDSNRETTIDYVINDPTTVKFEFVEDKQYGEVFELIKVDQKGKITNIDADPTVQYLPLNSDVNSPFGKPFILAAIFPAVWQLMLLKDIRDVLRTQVNPFVHVKIDMEKIMQMVGNDLEKALELSQKAKDTALAQWKGKKAGSAVGSGDETSYEIISGLNRMHLGMLDPIIGMLNSQIASGVNSMPIFLGQNEGSTESHTDVQWLIQTAFLRSTIKEVNSAISDDLNMMNQAAGIGGEVMFSILEMNAMERLREANIFVQEEEALIKLMDHLTLAFAEKAITFEEMVERYKERSELILHRTRQ